MAKPATPVDTATYIDVQRFLFREARLLDQRDYAGWLALTAEDLNYRVTAAVARDAGTPSVEYAIIDENRTALKSRIDQISTPRLTRAENPPSLTRRVVSNVEAFQTGTDGEIEVVSYMLAYRSRPSAREGGFYVAERHDVLRRTGTTWQIARRTARLDHTMLYDGALSTLL